MAATYTNAIDWMAQHDKDWIDSVVASLSVNGQDRSSPYAQQHISPAARLTAAMWGRDAWQVFDDVREARARRYQANRAVAR